jgi:LCP family protein required for cell wall assembly
MNHNRRPAAKRRLAPIAIPFLLLLLVGSGLAVWHQIECACGPVWFALGMPRQPYTVLVLGTDVPYSRVTARRQVGDHTAFTGRSDTMMLVMVDPKRRTIRGINIPRDTMTEIPGYGTQKINAANAIGGPRLAQQTVASMLGVNVDHYVVLNTQGLVDAVNELGGVTVDVPKKLSYMDWTAKLKIDLDPGVHTLTGNQAMGFVRFRHDDLGDIGRIQRQQIFMHATLAKLLTPISWPHIPALIDIGHHNLLSDMNDGQLFQIFNLVRSVPKKDIQFAMLPGHFGPYGSWVPDDDQVARLVQRVYGLAVQPESRENVTVCLKDGSSDPALVERTAHYLRNLGYSVVVARRDPLEALAGPSKTQIIAQRGNYDEAEMLMHDLNNSGEIVNASVGDIYSSITVVVADDMQSLPQTDLAADHSQNKM